MACAHSQIRQSITWLGNDGEAVSCLWVGVIGIRSISAHKSHRDRCTDTQPRFGTGWNVHTTWELESRLGSRAGLASLPQQQEFAPNHFGDFIPLFVSHSSQLLYSSQLLIASAYPFSVYPRVSAFLSSPLPSLCRASVFVLQQLRSLLCVSDSDVLIEEDLIGVINHLGLEGSWETVRRGPRSADSGQGKHPEI